MKWYFVALFLFCAKADAFPEYAVQSRAVSCTSCHVSPFGGGPRNLTGKLYGAHGYDPSGWQLQDKFSADARAILYEPKDRATTRHGAALMEVSPSANLPIKTFKDGSETRVVAVYSLGVVAQGPRDIYGQWLSHPTSESPTIVQLGRFNVPFGLMTDEHRTFTRMLTRTEIYDYEFGTSISNDIWNEVHYDFALSNGLESGGQFSQSSIAAPDTTVGGFANVRWTPASLPLLLGLSGAYHSRLNPNPSPYGISLYSVLSLDHATLSTVSGSISGEVVYSEHWADSNINPNIVRFFIPEGDLGYLNGVRSQPAWAWSSLLNINLSRVWVAQYKLDGLSFDPEFGGDRYLRHGFGVKYFVEANFIAMARYELADVGRPEIKTSNILAAQDAVWGLLQVNF